MNARRVPGDVIAALGLPEGAEWEDVRSADAEPSRRAMGLTSESARALVERDPGSLVPFLPNVTLWGDDARIACVTSAGVLAAVGKVEEADDELVLDARSSVPAVLFADAEGQWVLRYDADARRWETGRIAERSRLESLPMPEATSAPVLPPVTVAELMGGRSAEAWLLEQASLLLDAPLSVDRAAGAGLVLRLWSPTTGDGARRELEASISGDAGIQSAVLTWAGLATRATWDAVERSAVERVDALRESLGAFEDDIATLADASSMVTAVLHERDDLESVLAVLRLVGCGNDLAEALAAVDAESAIHLTALGDQARIDDDDRLGAVSWQEPEAWWSLQG